MHTQFNCANASGGRALAAQVSDDGRRVSVQGKHSGLTHQAWEELEQAARDEAAKHERFAPAAAREREGSLMGCAICYKEVRRSDSELYTL